jgi:hypothetical protein
MKTGNPDFRNSEKCTGCAALKMPHSVWMTHMIVMVLNCSACVLSGCPKNQIPDYPISRISGFPEIRISGCLDMGMAGKPTMARDLAEICNLGFLCVDFGIWECLQSIGIGLEIHLDGLSARELAYGPSSIHVHDFECFQFIWTRLPDPCSETFAHGPGP